MTPLQDRLRAALRETAGEIPPEAPPLRLHPARRTRTGTRQNGTRPAWREIGRAHV